jgi:hypothetical protein
MPHSNIPRLLSLHLALALAAAGGLRADPLSKKADIDFYRDVSSRDLHGLAIRSDGRLVGGPALRELSGPGVGELLWCLEPAPGGKWLVGCGPQGGVYEVAIDASAGAYSARAVAKLGDRQVYALKALPDGAILAGTAPDAGLYLIRGGKVAARLGLPADAIYDIILTPDAKAALVATGNPGRIYRIDLARFASSGVSQERAKDAKALGERGATLFGEAGDRNLRRLATLSDGRIAAGSAPKGNIYLFGADGGAPFIAHENHDAEVTDLLADASGGFFAAVVHSGGEIHPVQASAQAPVAQEAAVAVVEGAPTPNPNPGPPNVPNAQSAKPRINTAEILNAPAQVNFQGRSSLMRFGADGFSETLTTRQGVAFYRMCLRGDLLLISGGEQGEMSGYDLKARLSLTFAGSASSQVNAIEPVPGSPGRYLVIRNNAPGLALLDFEAPAPRTAQTKRVDLGVQARIGALRFNRLRDVDPSQVSVSIRTTNAAAETDGWSPWVPMANADGWRAQVPAGRYVELSLTLPAAASPALQLDKGALYYLTQDRRPQLQEFRMLSPNFAVVVPAEAPAPVTTTVGQLLQAGEHDGDRRKTAFNSSQVYSSPGTRVAFWTVTDPDGDNLLYTFSIRHEGEPQWTDIAVDTKDSYAQFDTLHLREGTWFTRLVARETAPRPAPDRLSVEFETDDMVVDHTPPEIEEASVRREAGQVIVTLRGRDALSILDSAEFTFNNGVHEVVEQPADGILDGMEETFVLELPAARLAGATSVEVTLYDSAGNGATRRLGL